MKPSKEKSVAPVAAETVAIEAVPVEAEKPESIVDDVFDAITGWAAQGLTVAKRGLEASARWLDASAKKVGELATKLASTPGETSA
jgi:hypothetical protein